MPSETRGRACRQRWPGRTKNMSCCVIARDGEAAKKRFHNRGVLIHPPAPIARSRRLLSRIPADGNAWDRPSSLRETWGSRRLTSGRPGWVDATDNSAVLVVSESFLKLRSEPATGEGSDIPGRALTPFTRYRSHRDSDVCSFCGLGMSARTSRGREGSTSRTASRARRRITVPAG